MVFFVIFFVFVDIVCVLFLCVYKKRDEEVYIVDFFKIEEDINNKVNIE